MPIKTLERRLAELGRLRMGRRVPTKGGKTRPERLAEWRLTSAHPDLLERAAALYGGSVQPWTDAPTEHSQHELFTDASALKVLIPPGRTLSQWMEAWSGGGCQRRCDGEREFLADQPCLCEQETARPRDYLCKPTTRLSVVLRDIPAVGVWRLEIHGYYGAVELAGMAQLLQDAGLAGRVVPAELRIEQRSIKRPGEPAKRFAVPVLAPESAFLELVVAEQQRDALEASRPALEPPAEQVDVETGEYYGDVEIDSSGRLDGDPHAPAQPAGPTPQQMRHAQQEATRTRQRVDHDAPTSIITLDQIRRLKSRDDARTLADIAPDEFKHALLNQFNHMDEWRAFWKDASLPSWKDHLSEAFTTLLETSVPVSAGPPAGPGDRPTSTGPALEGEAEAGPVDHPTTDSGETNGR